jgi:hypothetical protein
MNLVDTKISALTEITTPDSTDVLPIVNGGQTKKVQIANIVTSSTVTAAGAVMTEVDPVFTASQAANITVTDITNLGNLSGTNTGDQNILRVKYTGADCSLTDGDVNRVLTVAAGKTPILIVVDTAVLSEDDDWTVSGQDITFLVPIYDSQKIQVWRIS